MSITITAYTAKLLFQGEEQPTPKVSIIAGYTCGPWAPEGAYSLAFREEGSAENYAVYHLSVPEAAALGSFLSRDR